MVLSQREIDKKLREFQYRIYECETVEEAQKISEEVTKYIEENDLTMEQLKLLTESGASEMMNMMAG